MEKNLILTCIEANQECRNWFHWWPSVIYINTFFTLLAYNIKLLIIELIQKKETSKRAKKVSQHVNRHTNNLNSMSPFLVGIVYEITNSFSLLLLIISVLTFIHIVYWHDILLYDNTTTNMLLAFANYQHSHNDN